MSQASRLLQPGAMVRTDFSGKWSEHKIVERIAWPSSCSGIGFRVEPYVPKSTGGFLCADWFEPVEKRADHDDEIDGDAAIFADAGL